MARWSRLASRASMVVVVVLATVVVVSFVSAGVAHADACGDEPAFWDFSSWVSWEACEVSIGNPAAPVTEITSPLLDTIDSDIVSGLASIGSAVGLVRSAVVNLNLAVDEMSSSVVSRLDSVVSGVGGIVTGIVAFLSPDDGWYTPVTDAFTATVVDREPFSTIHYFWSDLSALNGSWSVAARHAGPRRVVFGPVGRPSDVGAVIAGAGRAPAGVGGPRRGVVAAGRDGAVTVVTPSDFGSVEGGIEAFLSALGLMGLGQDTLKAIFDWVISLAVLSSIGADVGVNIGMVVRDAGSKP